MISYGLSLWSTLLVLLGIWLLANAQGWIDGFSTEIFIILLLVVSGIWLLFGNFKKHHVHKNQIESVKYTKLDDNDFITQTVTFGGVDRRSDSQNVCGGTLTAIFGGVDLDLRSAKITNGAIFEVTSIFGGATIFLPPNCRVQTDGVPIFGGVDYKVRESSDPSLPLVIIKYVAVFGGIDLK